MPDNKKRKLDSLSGWTEQLKIYFWVNFDSQKAILPQAIVFIENMKHNYSLLLLTVCCIDYI